MLFNGRVIQAVKDNFLVLYNNQQFSCSASQKLRYDKNKIICGDIVDFDSENKHIIKIHKRKNKIIRPKVSNVDKVFITTSIREPNLATNLLDKMILFYTYYGVEPILIFSKSNLAKNKDYKEIVNEYKRAGYKILLPGLEKFNPEPFKKEIKDSVAIFAGQSGVGKSTILNSLAPQLNIKTNPISKALNRGKHTTTKSTLYNLFGGYICDTPGFSSIEQIRIKPINIANLFIDFRRLSIKCKFNNCIHINEIKCEVKNQVGKLISKNRYNNYSNIIKNIKGDK